MPRILVTGGAGFIGSHLCQRLLDQGHEVICLDNFYTGSKQNIRHLLDRRDRFEVIRHDVVEPILLEVDRIFHLACPASPVHYQSNPVKTLKTNVVGTLNMLGLAKRVKARMLLASTSEVYGDPTEHPQREEYRGNVNQLGPRACYDEGKRVAETLMMDYHRQHRLDIRLPRIFNTYGPHMNVDDGRVVSNFVVQALRGQDLTIYGDGQQTRSFCFVSDLVDGLVALMSYEGEGCHEPTNLGNPGEITMHELASSVCKLTGKKLTTVPRPLPQDDPGRRCPDITRAKKRLGFSPKISLQEGLKITIEDFKARLEAK